MSGNLEQLVLVVGALIVIGILLKAGLRRSGIPALIGYLVIGFGLRVLDDHTGLLGDSGYEVLGFLGTMGVAVLLFRVGLESNLPGLVRQLRSASLVWICNVAVSGAVGYAVARYILHLRLIPCLVVATALTATSVAISSHVWREARQLDTKDGQRFLDVAELDDISAVMLMALLFAVLPLLRAPGDTSMLLAISGHAGWFALKLAGFTAVCILFAKYVEAWFTSLVQRTEPQPEAMLAIAGVGLVVAGLAALLGFSVAIGAFFAGLTFSRDPRRVQVNASFSSLYELFSPFFFISIGLAIAPHSLGAAVGIGLALLLAAVLGKLLGAGAPSLLYTTWTGAMILGTSMIPRAEIAMLIMQRGLALGEWAVPAAVYSGMVLVTAVTCVVATPLLKLMLASPKPAGRHKPSTS